MFCIFSSSTRDRAVLAGHASITAFPMQLSGRGHPALATDMERCAVTSLSPGTDLVQQQSILQLQLPHHQLCHLLIEAVEAAMLCAKYRRSAPLAKSALALEERGASDWAQSTSATPS